MGKDGQSHQKKRDKRKGSNLKGCLNDVKGVDRLGVKIILKVVPPCKALMENALLERLGGKNERRSNLGKRPYGDRVNRIQGKGGIYTKREGVLR